MKTTKFMGGDFMEWFEDTFGLDNHYATNVAVNIIKYGKTNLSEEKIPELLASILPNVSEEEATMFLKTEISNLPEGYAWKHYEDGSGCITGPNGTKYFSYDRQPYANSDWVEYKKDEVSSWDIYYDGFALFKRFAEECIRDMERKHLKESIMEDYSKHDVVFSSSFLDIPANGLSMLDAVELYEKLQYLTNGDEVFFVKGAEIEGDIVTGGTIYGFDQVFDSNDKAPEGFTITEMLQQAEKQAELAGGKLLRLISSDIDGIPEEGSTIIKGEIVDFIF